MPWQAKTLLLLKRLTNRLSGDETYSCAHQVQYFADHSINEKDAVTFEEFKFTPGLRRWGRCR